MINETIFHAESAVFRAVTGSAYNIPNAYGEIQRGSAFPTKGTIPESVLHPGTMSSSGKAVRGTNTFFTRLHQGAYLYDGDVLRQIDYVVSDDLLFLKQAFPSDLSSDSVRVCERQFYKMIYAKSTHDTDAATLQEAPFRAGDTFTDGGAPLSYDASAAGEISFEVHQ